MNIDRFISLLLGFLELGRWDGSSILVRPPINGKQQVLKTVLDGALQDWQQVLNGQGRGLTDVLTAGDFAFFHQCQYYNFRAYPERHRQTFDYSEWVEAEQAAEEALRLIRTEYNLERI